MAYRYDASGNRTSRAAGGETVTYTWDALNQLTGVAYATAGDAVAYRYDALGRRIERAHTAPGQGTTTDRWVYAGENVVQQDRDGAVWQEYVHQGGLDNPLALVDHSGGAAAAYYYHRDGLGSVRALTDVTQAVAQSYTYTSYGVTTMANPGGLDQPFQYTAREWDAPSGLYYYRARYYDPAAGRFISQDPLRSQDSLNSYQYLNACPINGRDPLGLFRMPCKSECKAAVSAAEDQCVSIFDGFVSCCKEACDGIGEWLNGKGIPGDGFASLCKAACGVPGAGTTACHLAGSIAHSWCDLFADDC